MLMVFLGVAALVFFLLYDRAQQHYIKNIKTVTKEQLSVINTQQSIINELHSKLKEQNNYELHRGYKRT